MSATALAHDRQGPPGAPVVVLLHPIATDRMIWGPQTTVLAHCFDVIRIDLPGHGQSAAPTGGETLAGYAEAVAATLDSLRASSVAVVGLSLGGMVAQALALRDPQRISALVLAHTTGCTPPAVRDIWDERLRDFAVGGMAGQVAPTLDRWFTPAYREASPLTMRWVGGLIRSTDPAGYVAAVRAIQALDHLDHLRAVTAPTLVVSGTEDKAAAPAAGKLLADALPNARFAPLHNSAHIGNVEQPTAFTELVGGFLANATRS